ncbi:MAG: tetratricopeptide repeat protein [Candidatus Euphemobacter frigidus]|nr:tetratricopeptide repeat protein [Candidatus Euphemobacter frigidus]MDP8274948.1 tetratricopeptide repeat protein [Candidatus Euphemobacter frigidus]
MKSIVKNKKRERLSRRQFVLLTLILLLAFSLRFIFFYQMATSPIADMVIEDSKTYHDWAVNLAGGEWLGKEVFFALPLYPYLLGLIYAVFGSHLQVAKFIQVLIGSANCWLIFLLGRRFFNASVGLLAAFFMAIYGWLIVYDSAILSPVLIIFLNSLVLLYLLRLEDRATGWVGWLVAGVLIGLTTAASAHIIIFIPLVVVWLFLSPGLRRTSGRGWSAVAYLLGVIIALAPITIRNWYVGGDFVPLTAHGGINFFIGNNPHSRGVFEPPPILRSGGATLRYDAEKIASKAAGRSLQPSEVSAYWFGRGFDFIKEHPGRYLLLLGQKFTIFWDNLEIADVIHPYFLKRVAPILKLPFLVFGVIAPFALLGLILGWRERSRIFLLYFFVAGYIVSTVLYFVNSRYRLPLVPFLLLFAAYTLFRWWKMIRQKKWRAFFISFPALIIFILWVNPQLITSPRLVLNMGAGYNHLGAYYSTKGDLRRALVEFREALRLEPYRAEAHYNLANVQFRLGNMDVAERGYREAIRRNPFYDSAHLALAMIYERNGDTDKARLKYREIIKNLPFNTRAYLGLARLLIKEGRTDEAIRLLEKALAQHPDFPDFFLYLALAYEKKGEPEAAIAALERGLAVVPGDGRLHLELGRSLSAGSLDREKALHHLQAAVHARPDNYAAHLYLGDHYYRTGRIEDALREWEAARKIKPDDRSVAERLKTVSGRAAR